MLSLVMVPVWMSIDYIATVPAHCVIAVLVTAANIGRTNFRFTKYDGYFALFLLLSFAAVLVGGSSWAFCAQIVLRWGIPFLAARVLVSATGTRFAVNAIALIFGLVGGLAVLELVAAWHPFVGWNSGNLEYQIWHVIQMRNGGDRSEWAFGHSIALGGSLVLSIPFVLRSSYSRVGKVALLIAVGSGIAVTASRGAFIATVVTVLICCLYITRQRVARLAGLLITVPALLVASSFLASTAESLARGSSKEERGSAAYRDYLYINYLPRIEWFGGAAGFDITRKNMSIDSELIYLGLAFGWILLLAALFPLLLSLIRVLSGRATTAEIALVGQVPLLITVALITQYESIFFLAVGIAVQMIITDEGREPIVGLRDESSSQRAEPSLPRGPTAEVEARNVLQPDHNP
jgi:hypothetical protein